MGDSLFWKEEGEGSSPSVLIGFKMIIDESIEIKAPPAIVWKAVLAERVDFKTEVSNIKTKNEYDISQEFPSPFGRAKCSFHIKETPTAMYFNLISSNCFKRLSGQWTIKEVSKTVTVLNLSIEQAALKIAVPEVLVKFFSVKQVKGRLKSIKAKAESWNF